VLVEGQSDKDATRLQGRSRTNKLVLFEGDTSAYPVGSVVDVQTTEAFQWGFIGVAQAAQKPLVAPKLFIKLQPV